jgi:hypothetical protein
MVTDMKGKGVFMVRAVVADAGDRAGFDEWYEREHLPDALNAFGCSRAWRGWSKSDPAVHIAFYEFPDVATTERSTAAAVKDLVAEFDRVWGERVTRTREVLDIVGQLDT